MIEAINSLLGTSFENCLIDWVILVFVSLAIIGIIYILINSFRALILIHKIKKNYNKKGVEDPR